MPGYGPIGSYPIMAPSAFLVTVVVVLGHNNLQPYITIYMWRRVS
jgi:hypothetical protein